MELVSILIPNYNKAPYISETLDSVLAQTYTNWECIIVDDHSTDNSWKILEEYALKDSRFKIFQRPSHLPKGGNTCRNYAFELSNGEYIQWFDSDDLMLENMLEIRISEIAGYDFVVFSGMKFYKNIGDTDVIFSPLFYDDYISRFIALDPPWLTQSVLFSKEFIIQKSIKWDQKVLVLQDILYDLDCIFKTSIFKISTSKVNWFWRWHFNGSNLGSQRSKISSFPTLKKVFNFFSKVVKSNYTNLNSLKFSYSSILLDTKNRVGYRWIFYIYIPIFSFRLIGFSQWFKYLLIFLGLICIKKLYFNYFVSKRDLSIFELVDIIRSDVDFDVIIDNRSMTDFELIRNGL